MILEQVNVADTRITTFQNINKAGKKLSSSRSSKCNDVTLPHRVPCFILYILPANVKEVICTIKNVKKDTCFLLGDNFLMNDVADRINAGSEIVKQHVLRYIMVYFHCDIFQIRLNVKLYRVI
jgi:hypothetical protein